MERIESTHSDRHVPLSSVEIFKWPARSPMAESGNPSAAAPMTCLSEGLLHWRWGHWKRRGFDDMELPSSFFLLPLTSFSFFQKRKKRHTRSCALPAPSGALGGHHERAQATVYEKCSPAMPNMRSVASMNARNHRPKRT
jgi:hypothetical protein